MPATMLTQYIKIIQHLNEYGAQSIDQMSSSLGNLSPNVLKQAVAFLTENKIIGEVTGTDPSYEITKRVIGVLTYFNVKPSRTTIKLKR